MSSGFPWYFLINNRPVKVEATKDGGMDVLILNLGTGELERNMAYLAQCFEPGQDVQRVTEAEFHASIAMIRAALQAADRAESGEPK